VDSQTKDQASRGNIDQRDESEARGKRVGSIAEETDHVGPANPPSRPIELMSPKAAAADSLRIIVDQKPEETPPPPQTQRLHAAGSGRVVARLDRKRSRFFGRGPPRQDMLDNNGAIATSIASGITTNLRRRITHNNSLNALQDPATAWILASTLTKAGLVATSASRGVSGSRPRKQH
jgi:hypothetical protein